MNWNCNSHNKASTRMRNLTESRSLVRNQLKAHPNPNILFSLQNDPSPTTRIDVQHAGMWGGSPFLTKGPILLLVGAGGARPSRAQAKNRISFLTFIPGVLFNTSSNVPPQVSTHLGPHDSPQLVLGCFSFFWPFWQKLGMSQ